MYTFIQFIRYLIYTLFKFIYIDWLIDWLIDLVLVHYNNCETVNIPVMNITVSVFTLISLFQASLWIQWFKKTWDYILKQSERQSASVPYSNFITFSQLFTHLLALPAFIGEIFEHT